jgi:hypothetical protein
LFIDAGPFRGVREDVMPEMAVSRTQRLRTLESQIRKDYEAFVATGFALMEIRDDRLYEEDGYETWDAYLKDRVGAQFGIEQTQAFQLVACAQIRTKLPDINFGVPKLNSGKDRPEWTQAAVYAFGRLAPKNEDRPGHPPDYDALRKKDVERVARKVIAHCEREETRPTATIVRKYVDEELGINRAAQAQETRRQREEASFPELHRYLDSMTSRLEANVEQLSEIADNEEVWTLLAEKHPGLIKRFIAVCDSLADLRRRLGR